MIIGYFDFAVIGILALANILIWKNREKVNISCLGILVSGAILGLILPIISQKIEIDRAIQGEDIIDNFTLLYTYFKFSVYWIICLLQIATITIMEKIGKS